MYRSNYDNMILGGNRSSATSQKKTLTPMGDRRNQSNLPAYLNSNRKQFFESTVAHRDGKQYRNTQQSRQSRQPKDQILRNSRQKVLVKQNSKYSDYQIGINSNNKLSNCIKQQRQANTIYPSQQPTINHSKMQNLSLQALFDKIHQLTLKVNKNQQAIKNLMVFSSNKYVTMEQLDGFKVELIKSIEKNTMNNRQLRENLTLKQQSIDQLRQQLNKINKLVDMQEQFQSIQSQIKSLINCIKIDLGKSTQQLGEKYQNVLHSQINKIQQQLQQKITFLQKNYENIQKNDKNNKKLQFFTSNKIFTGTPINFVYSQHLHMQLNEQNFKNQVINQVKYHIDSSGYILDSNKHYLMDFQQKLIRLTDKQLQILKQLKVLQ